MLYPRVRIVKEPAVMDSDYILVLAIRIVKGFVMLLEIKKLDSFIYQETWQYKSSLRMNTR